MKRYHITRQQKRTTVSLPAELHGLLSLHLGYAPDDADAHQAVTQWLQSRVDDADDPGRKDLSQWLQSEAVLEIADKKLAEAYLGWLTGVEIDGPSPR